MEEMEQYLGVIETRGLQTPNQVVCFAPALPLEAERETDIMALMTGMQRGFAVA